jgi:hypothetical protein
VPHLGADPERPGIPGHYDCDECRYGITSPDGAYKTPPKRTEAERAAIHCGWMDERRWTGPGCVGTTMAAKPSVGFAGIEWTEGECPGWAARAPLIVEVGEAYAASELGALHDYFPDMTNVLAEGLLELKRAVGEYDRVATAVMKTNVKNG